MADVHVLPGIERRDMVSAPTESRLVLEAAIENGITDATVVGRDRQGHLYVAGAQPDVDRTVGLLMRAVSVLSSLEIVNDAVIATEPPPGVS